MRAGLRGERLIALFILGWLLFDPPLVNLFGAKATVLGLPLLYLYLFTAWAAVIAIAALIISRPEEPERVDPPPRPDGSQGT